jgi:hypothetical protein
LREEAQENGVMCREGKVITVCTDKRVDAKGNTGLKEMYITIERGTK